MGFLLREILTFVENKSKCCKKISLNVGEEQNHEKFFSLYGFIYFEIRHQRFHFFFFFLKAVRSANQFHFRVITIKLTSMQK